jgi:hypothetical protein
VRLISKFKDYYDTALVYGIDPTLFYHRELVELVSDIPDEIRHKYLHVNKGAWRSSYETSIWASFPRAWERRYGHGLVLYVIGFCGVLYPVLKYRKTSGDEEFFYSCDFDRLRVEVEQDDNLQRSCFHMGSGRYRQKTSDWDELMLSVKNLEDVHWLDPFVQFGVPSFVCSLDFHTGRENPKLILNPCLKEYNFPRVKDPYTAFQELSMFLGGVIPRQLPDTVVIGDMDRLVGHGFDKKLSFRTSR